MTACVHPCSSIGALTAALGQALGDDAAHTPLPSFAAFMRAEETAVEAARQRAIEEAAAAMAAAAEAALRSSVSAEGRRGPLE